MKYVLENSGEALRLEKQSMSVLYDPLVELVDFDLRRGQKILDAGCGSGLVARAIQRLHPDTRVTAIDASTARITEAKNLAGESSKIEFRVANVCDPALSALGKFDRIMCRFLVEHLSAADQIVAVRNLAAVLRGNGQLRLIDMDGGMLNIYPQTPWVKECLTIFEKKKAFDFFAGRRLTKLLVDAGLSSVTWRVQTMVMNTEQSLQEEVALIKERFEHTLPAMMQLLGSRVKAELFQKQYIKTLTCPGTTLFYNKFIATGVNHPRGHLKAV